MHGDRPLSQGLEALEDIREDLESDKLPLDARLLKLEEAIHIYEGLKQNVFSQSLNVFEVKQGQPENLIAFKYD